MKKGNFKFCCGTTYLIYFSTFSFMVSTFCVVCKKWFYSNVMKFSSMLLEEFFFFFTPAFPDCMPCQQKCRNMHSVYTYHLFICIIYILCIRYTHFYIKFKKLENKKIIKYRYVFFPTPWYYIKYFLIYTEHTLCQSF